MGYVKEPDVLSLVWDEDTKYPGLHVKAVMPTTGEYLKVVGMVRADRLSTDDIEELCSTFAPRLISWDLEVPDGENGGSKPVPATLAGLLSQDFDFVSDLIVRWVTATSNIKEDLGKDSPSGDPFPEGSIPMEPLSESPQSLSTPN